MSRCIRTPRALYELALVMSALLAGTAASAATTAPGSQAPTLMLSDGFGNSVSITGTGVATCTGSCTTTSSSAAQAGVVTWAGTLGIFNISSASGQSKPALAPPQIALGLRVATGPLGAGGSGSTLTARWSDTGFSGTGPVKLTASDASTGSVKVSYSGYVDGGNALFGTGTSVGTIGAGGSISGPGPSSAPFSMTEVATITMGGSSSYTLTSLNLMAVAPPNITIQASYINRDNPPPLNNQVYVPLPAGTPVYVGSGPVTSDSLALTAVLGPPGTQVKSIVWSADGTGSGALIPPVPGPNTKNWVVSPLPAGVLGSVTFTATALLENGGQIAANIVIQVGIRSDDVIVLGWINPAGVPALPAAGVDPVVTIAMPNPTTTPFGFPRNIACNGVVGELASGLPLTVTTVLGVPVPTTLTALDLNYILLWLFRYGSNPNPTTVLSTLGTGRGDFLDPKTNFTSAAQVAAYTGTVTNYKLFNRLQIKFLSNGTGFTAAPTYLQQQVGVGTTINPCGPATVPPLVVSVIPPVFTPPVTVPALFPGQIGPANGPPAIRIVNAANPNGVRVSQINDGSPDEGAIRAFDEITQWITPTPVFWENIGSRITFTAAGPTATIAVQAYPTYYIYTNGLRTRIIPQAANPLGNFNAAPYPFGTVPCSIGTIVPLPGAPFIAPMLGTISGGRCGDASSPPAISVRVPPPPYTVP